MEKYLEAGDLAKIACNNCQGCHACCTGMGQSIVLSPLDVYRLEVGLDMTFEQLLASYIVLHVVDGIILPNLKMNEQGICPFSSEWENFFNLSFIAVSPHCQYPRVTVNL